MMETAFAFSSLSLPFLGILILGILATSKKQWDLFNYYLISIGFLLASYSVGNTFFQSFIAIFPPSWKFDEFDLVYLFNLIPLTIFLLAGYKGFMILNGIFKYKYGNQQRMIAGMIYIIFPLLLFLVPRSLNVDIVLLMGVFTGFYLQDWLLKGVPLTKSSALHINNEPEVEAFLVQVNQMIDKAEGQMWDNLFIRGNILFNKMKYKEAETDFEQVISLLNQQNIGAEEKLYLEKSYSKLAEIKVNRGDKNGAKNDYAMALSYSKDPQAYVVKMKEVSTSRPVHSIKFNYRVVGACFVLSLGLVKCTQKDDSMAIVVSENLRKDILIGKWDFKTEIKVEDNLQLFEGDVLFKADGTFKRNVKIKILNGYSSYSPRTEYIGGGFFTGKYEIVNEGTNFSWREIQEQCNLNINPEAFGYKKINLCKIFKDIAYGELENKIISKIEMFTRNKIIITGEDLKHGSKLRYELTRK